jgi:hypothetical protein
LTSQLALQRLCALKVHALTAMDPVGLQDGQAKCGVHAREHWRKGASGCKRSSGFITLGATLKRCASSGDGLLKSEACRAKGLKHKPGA